MEVKVQVPTPPPANVTVVTSGGAEPVSPWEPVRRGVHVGHKIRNTNTESWSDVYKLQRSVIPNVIVPSLGITVFAALVAVFYKVPAVAFLANLKLPNSTLLVTILGTAMSLLLVFRVNSAYDRFWEGRKIWSSIHFHTRNLARLVWVYVKPKSHEEAQQQKGAMNLLIAFPAATKHVLRDEPGHRWADLGPYLQHINVYGPDVYKSRAPLPAPLEITLHLQSYVNRYSIMQFPASNSIGALADALSNLQRVRQTPIPAAYTLHLKQTLVVYLLSLPFQIVAALGWFTIPVTFFCALIMLGIEVIGGEIENPFGFDHNDLPLDEYCDEIRAELFHIMRDDDPSVDPFGWIQPMNLSHNKVDSATLKAHTKAALEASVQRKETGLHHWVGGMVSVAEKVAGAMEREAETLLGVRRV